MIYLPLFVDPFSKIGDHYQTNFLAFNDDICALQLSRCQNCQNSGAAAVTCMAHEAKALTVDHFVVSPVSRHFPYLRDFFVSKQFWKRFEGWKVGRREARREKFTH